MNTLNARFDSYDKATVLFDANLNRIPTATDRAVAQLKELQGETIAKVSTRIDDNRMLTAEKFEAAKMLSDGRLVALVSTIEGNRFFSDTAIGENRTLSDEKFAGIQKQFIERDTRVEQTARDTKVAVDAALQAAEKAVGKQNESFSASINKSEAATTKQIDQQAATLSVAVGGLDSKISDLKDRVGRIENTAVGLAQSEARLTSQKTLGTSNNGIAVSVIVAVIAAAALFAQHVTFH